MADAADAPRAVDVFDEFSFLPAQAAELGVTAIPRAERLDLALPDGRTLSALRYGGDAPRVTFLHGAGLNAHTWDTTILALGAPALAIDLAGHGDSSWRDDVNYTAHPLAEDVVRALDAWTTGPQVLVGHSLGGLVAAAVAASRPDLVCELVVVDITPGVDVNASGPSQLRDFFSGPTDWATRDELVDRALAFGLGGTRQAAERGVYLNSRVRADGRVEWKHHFAHLAAARPSTDTPAADATAGSALAALLSSSGWDDLAGVPAPITLLRGERGYVTDANLAEFVERVPNARIEPVASGHNVQEEIPAVLAAAVRGRLDANA
ncbi:alpha/beta hydrolase [Microbacterium sp. X-17]|uniref:alpha/beta fold hydrolase n=1 Tax=Microbacterium sp. X-17 TaxID=3144404 RepID=UPI0031F4BC5A